MIFQEMDPELAWKLIEGYPNELDSEMRKLEAYYRQFDCPQCGGPCRREVNVHHAFKDPDYAVPRSLLRCLTCNCLFNPHKDSLILERGR